MGIRNGSYVVARWEDRRGSNTVAGIVRGVRADGSLVVTSLGGHGMVEVPAGAALFRPQGPGRPMRRVR